MDRSRIINIFEDLRKRLIIVTVTVIVFALVCFAFSGQIRAILVSPADMAYSNLNIPGAELQLIFLTPAEAMLANLKLAFMTGILIALPFLLYHLVAFVMVAAGIKSKRALLISFMMYILFAAGISFAYFIVLPFALNFFIGFSADDLLPNFSFARYISFVTSMIFSFGLVFQIPIIFWFLGSIGLLNTDTLRRNRKYALLVIVIAASILTPPDIFSQVLMAIPLLLLYELGIIMVHFASRRRRKEFESGDPA